MSLLADAIPLLMLILLLGLVDMDASLAPTAKVVWLRAESTTARPGMGLQFLKLDRDAAQCIDDYVDERAAVEPGA